MKRVLLAGVLLATVSMAVGCRGVSEGMGAVMGAKHSAANIQPMPKVDMIGPVTVEEFTTDVPALVPASWLASLTSATRKRVAEEDQLRAGRPVTVSGVVIHREGSGVMGQVMGPDSEVVVRVTVREGGKVLGVANVIGRARSSTSSSEGDLSDAVGKGVVEFLKSALKK